VTERFDKFEISRGFSFSLTPSFKFCEVYSFFVGFQDEESLLKAVSNVPVNVLAEAVLDAVGRREELETFAVNFSFIWSDVILFSERDGAWREFDHEMAIRMLKITAFCFGKANS